MRLAALESCASPTHSLSVGRLLCRNPEGVWSTHHRYWNFENFIKIGGRESLSDESYMFEGDHVTLYSSSPVTDRLFPIIEPLNVTSTSRPRITDSAFSSRYWRMSIIPTSKKSKRRAIPGKRKGRISFTSSRRWWKQRQSNLYSTRSELYWPTSDDVSDCAKLDGDSSAQEREFHS